MVQQAAAARVVVLGVAHIQPAGATTRGYRLVHYCRD